MDLYLIMTLAMYIIIFAFGLCVGSFLNVCVYRLPRHESLIYPSSHCPACSNKLKWYHLIPVFSFIFLGGKCGFCNSRISFRYPIIEFVNGLAWMLIYVCFDISILSIVRMVGFSIIFTLFLILIEKASRK